MWISRGQRGNERCCKIVVEQHPAQTERIVSNVNECVTGSLRDDLGNITIFINFLVLNSSGSAVVI